MKALFASFAEWFAQTRAERLARRCPPDRRAEVQLLAAGVTRRVRMARDAVEEHYDAVALSLLRQAVVMAANAVLVGSGVREPGSHLTAAQCAELIDAGAFDSEIGPPLPAWQGVHELMLAEDPSIADRLEASEARAKLGELRATLAWLRAGFEARTVRRVRGVRWLRIGAIAVLSLIVMVGGAAWVLTPTNIALGKPVTASSHRPGTPAAEGVVDGVRTGSFGAHTLTDGKAWFTIDLLEPYRIRRVVVYNRGDGLYEQMLPLVLELSLDGKSFERAAVRDGTFTDRDPWSVTLKHQVARYVRLRVDHKGAYIALNEIEVYGSPAH